MQRGWTLKQLLVVLAIIALLAAITYPVVQIIRYRALEARCRANLWAIAVKYSLIKEQNGGKVDTKLYRAFRDWLHTSPEADGIRMCPMGGREYMVALDLHPRYMLGGVGTLSQEEIALLTPDPHMVVFCLCHKRPMPRSRECVVPVLNAYQVLAAYDYNDGPRVKYGYVVPQLAIPMEWLPADERE